MKKNFLLRLVGVAFIILFLSNTVSAVEIDTYPAEINLITDIQNSISEQDRQDSAPITISDLDSITTIGFRFESSDLNLFMEQEVFIYLYNPISGSWDNWRRWDIAQPLNINFPDDLPPRIKEEVLSDDLLTIKFVFLVPQSIDIRQGDYSGNISLLIDE